MGIDTRDVDYEHDGLALRGHLAVDNAVSGPRPLVMVCHAFAGRGPSENARAEALARLGYAGFALDVYGAGVLGESREENQARMQQLLDNRALLQDRLRAALSAARAQPEVDASRCAVIGYCFGGLCAMDMARSGADVAGIVSFHGLFTPPDNLKDEKIAAKMLILHGWDDPMAPPEQALALTRELSDAGADWQLHAYGNTLHAFTNPAANDRDFGTVYDADADRRSWQAMQNFLTELF